jgi:hypothetical protein
VIDDQTGCFGVSHFEFDGFHPLFEGNEPFSCMQLRYEAYHRVWPSMKAIIDVSYHVMYLYTFITDLK